MVCWSILQVKIEKAKRLKGSLNYDWGYDTIKPFKPTFYYVKNVKTVVSVAIQQRKATDQYF